MKFDLMNLEPSFYCKVADLRIICYLWRM